jgi:hypothetical protein
VEAGVEGAPTEDFVLDSVSDSDSVTDSGSVTVTVAR